MANKVCHRFSRLDPPSPLDLKGSTGSLRTVQCIGGACSLFVPNLDAEGKPTVPASGTCADTLIAIAQMRSAMALEMLAHGEDDEEGDEPSETPKLDPPSRLKV
jgi:hypothetical protein